MPYELRIQQLFDDPLLRFQDRERGFQFGQRVQ